MSQTKWIRGPICGIDNCRSRLYKRDSGRKFCQFGHVAEGDLDIEDEDGDGGPFTQTKRLNIQITDTGFGSQISSKSAQDGIISTGKGDRRLYGTSGLVHQYKCFQYILRDITPKVIRCIYSDYGDTALESLTYSVDPIVKLLWIRFVKKTFNHTIPSVIELYVVVYLALRQLNRYPIFVDQYIEMISKNKVPVLNVISLLPVSMKMMLPASSAAIFSPTKMLVEDAFYCLLAKWTTDLNLRGVCATPLDYTYPLAFKLFTDLRIPHAPQLLAVYHELGQEVTGGVLKQQAMYSAASVPELQFVGLAFCVIRLYLISSPEIFDSKQWVDWVTQSEELSCFSNRTHHIPPEEIVNMSHTQISKYLEWVHENMIPSRYKDLESDDLSTIEKKLNKVFIFKPSIAGFMVDDANSGVNVSLKPLQAVENTLSPLETAQVEMHLEKYLCTKFGIKKTTLHDIYKRVDSNLRQTFS